MRLSCGARMERSQINDYLRNRGADSFRGIREKGSRRFSPLAACRAKFFVVDAFTGGVVRSAPDLSLDESPLA